MAPQRQDLIFFEQPPQFLDKKLKLDNHKFMKLNLHKKLIISLFAFLISLISVSYSFANGYRYLTRIPFVIDGQLHSVAVVENEISGGAAGFLHIVGEKDVVLTGEYINGRYFPDSITWFLSDALQHKGVSPKHDYFSYITIENIKTFP